MIFGQQRDQFRRVFVDVWRKHSKGTLLEPLEQSIAAVIDAHPEYHEMLADPDSLVRDYPTEGEGTNPFLHMGMHISIVEQITSDRPAGIRTFYDALRGRFPDTHDLEHAMMQCLAKSLWEARERDQPPDERRYLSCVHRLQRRLL
jgi:hypothetical protein